VDNVHVHHPWIKVGKYYLQTGIGG